MPRTSQQIQNAGLQLDKDFKAGKMDQNTYNKFSTPNKKNLQNEPGSNQIRNLGDLTPKKSKTVSLTPTQPKTAVSPAASPVTPSTGSSASPTIPSPLPMSEAGVDTSQATAAGVDANTAASVKSVYNPLLDATQGALQDEEQRKKEITSSLDQEQKTVEEGYASIKDQYLDINKQQQELINESASIQTEKLKQAQSKEQFQLSQEKQKYEDDMLQAKRDAQREIQEQEAQLSRSLASSIGGGKGFQAMMQYQNFQQDGVNIITDLKATTAWGMAEFGFRAQDIDRSYTTAINEIEVQRRDQNVGLLSALSTTLASLDEKVLISASEKQSLARDAINKYFDNKEALDNQHATYVSEANAALAIEVENIKKEKEEKERLDVNMSQSLGFFANSWGEPINTRADGKPVPFIGQYDESLSSQFGHLVDDRGNAILGADGQQIPFKSPEVDMFNNSLSNYLTGEGNGYDLANLNEKIGTNGHIASSFPDGSHGGQCGTFVRTKFTTEGAWETACVGLTGNEARQCSLNSKRQLVNSRGFRRGAGVPSVGDVVIFDKNYGSVGHYAMINSISQDGKTMTLTESNMNLDEKVTNTRTVPIDNGSVYGFFTPNHTDQVKNNQPVLNTGVIDSEGGQDGENFSALSLSNQEIESKFNPFGYTIEDATKANATENGVATNMMRAWEAEELLRTYDDKGVDISSLNTIASQMKPDPLLGYVPMSNIIAQINSPQERDVMRARLRWIENVLRPASGAAISVEEYASYEDMYFTPPSADAAEIKNAEIARLAATETLALQAGRAAPKITHYMNSRDKSRYQVSEGTEAPVSTDEIVGTVNEGVKNTANALGTWWDTANKEIGKTNAPKINFDMSTLSADQINQLFQ